ncbi:MAG: hypothetical protein ACJAW7_002582 [Candidatus Azotimanducaceae bacterium]|jgi:hypothetical protein
MSIDQLVKNRWEERNKELNDRIRGSQGDLAARGMIRSGQAISDLHEIFSEEFTASRKVIVQTIVDCLFSGVTKFDREYLNDWAKERLVERQIFLDSHFQTRGKPSLDSVTNQTMIAHVTNVAQYLESSVLELSIEVKIAMDEYQASLGNTLYDRVLNKFKNYPLVVVPAVVITVLLAIFGLVSAIKALVS